VLLCKLILLKYQDEFHTYNGHPLFQHLREIYAKIELDMFILVSYDISDDKKRTKLAKKLKDFGPRVQYSVFEADVKKAELEKLNTILAAIELEQGESIRLYKLCQECIRSVKIWGEGEITADKDYYIV